MTRDELNAMIEDEKNKAWIELIQSDLDTIRQWSAFSGPAMKDFYKLAYYVDKGWSTSRFQGTFIKDAIRAAAWRFAADEILTEPPY